MSASLREQPSTRTARPAGRVRDVERRAVHDEVAEHDGAAIASEPFADRLRDAPRQRAIAQLRAAIDGSPRTARFAATAAPLIHAARRDAHVRPPIPRRVVQRVAAGPAVLQRELGDDFDWAGAGSIRRSGEGAEGVIFVTAAGGEIVVKFLKAAAGADQADKTMRATGVAVPDSRIVKNSDADALGGRIRALIAARLGTLTEVQQAQVTAQMKDYGYIQLQQKTAGIGLDKLNSEQVQAFLKDAALVQEVGKIAAIDSFLGNTDRLSKSLTNTGNYMIVDGGEGPTLVAIDNEMHAKKAANKAAREGEVRFIMSDAGVTTISGAFLMKLTGLGQKYKFTEEDEAFVKANIALGIKAGAEAIAALMKAQPGFINAAKETEKTQLPGPQGTGTKQRDIVRSTLKARVTAMQEQYLSGGFAKLQQATE